MNLRNIITGILKFNEHKFEKYKKFLNIFFLIPSLKDNMKFVNDYFIYDKYYKISFYSIKLLK